MIRSIVRHAAVCAVALTWSGAVFAQSIPDTVARWKMLGTWALECSKPPSRDNTYENFVKRGTNVFLERNGGDYKDSNRVLAASITPEGLLELRIEFKAFSQTRVNVFVKGPDGRKRAMTNHDTKGSYSVKDGKFVSSNNQTSWMTRCR